MQKEREDHQTQLAELIRERAVQKKLQQKPSMRVSFPQGAESPALSRASTPSPPHAFVYDYDAAAADNCATVNDDDVHDVGICAQGVDQIKQTPPAYPNRDTGFSWCPAQDSITLVKEKPPTVDFPLTENVPLSPPGYVLVPIGSTSATGHVHSTPVDTGVGFSIKADPNSTSVPLLNTVSATDCVVSPTPKTVPESTMNMQSNNVNAASVSNVSGVVGTPATETPAVLAAPANVNVASVVASSAPAVAIVSSGVVSSATINSSTVSSALTSTTPVVTAPVNPTVVVK